MSVCVCVPGASPKIIKLQEELSDYTDPPKGKSASVNSTLVPVKGINNLGNTCFFNSVMQVSTDINWVNLHVFICLCLCIVSEETKASR